MEFSRDCLSNKLFYEHALSFDELSFERSDVPPDAGAKVLSNGDVELKVFAPHAKKVVIRAWIDEIDMNKRSDGMFEGILPFRISWTGPRTLDIYVDGDLFLSPHLPIYWTANRPVNFVEVPDPDMDYLLIKDVPHGMMTHATFWSEPMKNWERCTIYTPPGYMNGSESYPVLYLQNGGSDNETSWEYSGRIARIMDNLLAEKKALPFIIVMNNTMLRYDGKVSNTRDRAYEEMLINCCIPYIDSNFRTKTDKWNRAIAGLSMGSYMTNDIGLWHPETFGSIGAFTASMSTLEHWEVYERPYPEIIKDAEAFGKNYKLFYRSTTPLEDHFNWFEDDDALCAKYGIDKLPGYHRNVYSNTTSKWNSWRLGFRDFAQLLFRD